MSIKVLNFIPKHIHSKPSFLIKINGVEYISCELEFFENTKQNIIEFDKEYGCSMKTQELLSFRSETCLATDGKITDMQYMFSCSGSLLNESINHWDVSNVTNMKLMFFCAELFNQPLNDWNVSNVTNMKGMFSKAKSFNQPLNEWDTSNVTDMSHMFNEAKSFNQPLNDWDVSSVINMRSMFECTSSFNQPLNDWDVSSVTDMNDMFFEASSFNQPLNDWSVSSVIFATYSDHYSFYNDSSLNKEYIPHFQFQ